MNGSKRKTETDVLVIGSGAAGMMAAIAAVKADSSCIVLEKGSHIAVSNGARAGGPALADTDVQRREKATVSEEILFGHMYRFSRGTVDAGLLRRAVAKGRAVEQIFQECGIGLRLLDDSYGVGFRARHGFLEGGRKRWQPLADKLESLGGQIRLNCQALGLEREPDHRFRVTAAWSESQEETEEYIAKNVIIATGGYLGNPSMIEKYLGKLHVVPLGNTLSDGAGIRMLVEAGGAVDKNWGICGNEFSGANHKAGKGNTFTQEMRYAICGGLLVNPWGKRFMNEQHLSDMPLSIGGGEILREGRFYAVLDENMYRELQEKSLFEYYGSPKEWLAGARNQDPLRNGKKCGLDVAIRDGWAITGTLDEVVKKAKMPELKKTVEEYNRICEKKKDLAFGKAGYLLKPLEKEPYYLFEYEPSAWCTFGGVKTNDFCQVLNEEGEALEGLYAAGVDNGSCYTAPYYDNEGAALGLALATGIIAGEHSAAERCVEPQKQSKENTEAT